MIIQESPGETRLWLWGKVIEHKLAEFMNPTTRFPLGSHGDVEWWLDGSQYVNKYKSDMCLGWMVPVEGSKHKKEKEIAEARSSDCRAAASSRTATTSTS